MKLKVFDIEGKETSKNVTLPKEVFGIEPNDHAIYLAVKHYMAEKRRGTHKTKERSEVRGSTRKIKRQKGTGTARAGDIKNPLFRGGGRVFGPRPKDYGFKLNKKVNTLAKKSALSYKAKDGNVMLVEEIKMEQPKTKEFINVMENLGIADARITMITNGGDANMEMSARNIQNIKLIKTDDINTYDVLNCDKLLITVDSMDSIKNKLSDPNE